MRGTSLGAMLRAWRDRARPDGPTGGRRAKGLRREELAALTGISVDYVVRLEQGRAAHPSAQVVASLARALRLSAVERAHLHQLAGIASPNGKRVPDQLSPGVKRMMERVPSTPIAVFTATWTFLSGNAAWEALQLSSVKAVSEHPNLVWRMFLGADTRVLRSQEEHDAFAAGLVSDLRGAAARYPADAQLQVLIDELLERSEAFSTLWTSATVKPHWAKQKSVNSRLGVLQLDCDVLTTEGDLRLVLYTAEPGSDSEQLLLRLIGAPPSHEGEGR